MFAIRLQRARVAGARSLGDTVRSIHVLGVGDQAEGWSARGFDTLARFSAPAPTSVEAHL